MADFPYLPVWVADFMGDTQHLDCTESGAYLLLLFAAWRTPECGLPDDDRKLARLARCSLKRWRRLKPTVMAFWNLSEDSLWHQKRLDEERQKASVKSHTSALNVGARWLKTNKTTHTAVSSPYYGGDTNHSHSHNHNQNLYSENHAVAASAAGDPGGPPRSPTPSHDGMSVPPTLTSHDTWQQRLAGYDPSNMRKTWHPTWGPTPDSAGHQPLIPKDLLATWRSSKGMGHA